MEPSRIKQIIEAALLASGQPMSAPRLMELFADEKDPPVELEHIARALESLQTDCDQRGVELVEVASGFRLQVRQNLHPWVARMWTERPSRYSRALLETMALIAYRQPLTRGDIEQVRGVTVSSHIIKTLEEREWVRVVGHRDTPGRPALFGTTRTFLDYFDLKSLEELPPLADILDADALGPQLALDEQAAKADGEDTATTGENIGAHEEPPASDAQADDPDTRDTGTPAPDATGHHGADASETANAEAETEAETVTVADQPTQENDE